MSDRIRVDLTPQELVFPCDPSAKQDYKDASDLAALRTLAEEFGCELVEPKDGQLLLDIDLAPGFAGQPDGWYEAFGLWRSMQHAKLQLIGQQFHGVIIEDYWRSRNGGLHILVRLGVEKQSEETYIALQALLGSDPKREIMALWELRAGRLENTRTLFRPKERGAKPFGRGME